MAKVCLQCGDRIGMFRKAVEGLYCGMACKAAFERAAIQPGSRRGAPPSSSVVAAVAEREADGLHPLAPKQWPERLRASITMPPPRPSDRAGFESVRAAVGIHSASEGEQLPTPPGTPHRVSVASAPAISVAGSNSTTSAHARSDDASHDEVGERGELEDLLDEPELAYLGLGERAGADRDGAASGEAIGLRSARAIDASRADVPDGPADAVDAEWLALVDAALSRADSGGLSCGGSTDEAGALRAAANPWRPRTEVGLVCSDAGVGPRCPRCDGAWTLAGICGGCGLRARPLGVGTWRRDSKARPVSTS